MKNFFNISNLCIRTISPVLGVLLVLLVSGCAHYQVDFSLVNDNFKPKGKSIAVISGTKEPSNQEIASMVADSLRKASRFQVMPPAQVAHAVHPYPQTIKGPYKSAYFQIDTDWDLGDRNRIAEIQRALGVDYLYVIWSPIAVSFNNSTVYQVPAVAQMFEPAGKVVAKTEIMLLLGDENNKFAKEGTDEIAAQLAEKTGMSTAKKK